MRSLSSEHWLLLAVLGIAGFFEGYDSFIFTVALPQIRESFGLSQAAASLWLAVLFVGSIPAIFVTRYADVHGRRRLLVLSIVGYSLFTGITALSPNMTFFVYTQFVARLFLHAECALAWTLVAEELPARSRGFGFGWLAMVSAGGTAAGSILYGGLYAPLGLSWRWLYVIGLPPLVSILLARKRLPESKRFAEARANGELEAHWTAILRKPHRRWFVLMGSTDMLFAFATIVDVFTIDYMQTERGLSATRANLLLVAAGLLAIPVLQGAGAMSDRYGRKIVGCFFGLMNVFGIVGFFLVARGSISLFVFLLVMLVGQFGSWPTLDAYYAELFPTGLRAFAGSAMSVWRVPGEVMSMVVGSVLIHALGGIGTPAVILATGPCLAVWLVWKKFPETRGRELEEINSGDTLPAVPLPEPVAALRLVG